MVEDFWKNIEANEKSQKDLSLVEPDEKVIPAEDVIRIKKRAKLAQGDYASERAEYMSRPEVRGRLKQNEFIENIPSWIKPALRIPGATDLVRNSLPAVEEFTKQVDKFPASFNSAANEPERQGLLFRKNTGQKFTAADQIRLNSLTGSQNSDSLVGEIAGGLVGTVKEGAAEIAGGAITGASIAAAPAAIQFSTGIALPLAPLTLTGGVVTGALYGLQAAGARQGYVQGYNDIREFGSTYRDDKGHALNPTVVGGAAQIAGVANGVLNGIGLGALTKAIPGSSALLSKGAPGLMKALLTSAEGRSLIARVGSQVVEQGGIAGLTTLIQEATKAGISLDSKVAAAIPGKVQESAIKGATTGLILGGTIETGTSAALKAIGKAHRDAGLHLDPEVGNATVDVDKLRGIRAQVGDTELHTLAQKLGKSVEEVKADLGFEGVMPAAGYPITDGKWATVVEQNDELRKAFDVEVKAEQAAGEQTKVDPIAQKEALQSTLIESGLTPEQAASASEFVVRGAATVGLDLNALGITPNAKLPKGVQGQLGRSGIKLSPDANISTILHETGHAYRRELAKNLTNPENKVINDFVGAKDSNWTRAQEEKYTAAIENYFRTGKVGDKVPVVVKNLITDVAKEFRDVYRSALDIPNVSVLTPDIVGHLDRLYQVEREFSGLNLPKATILETAAKVSQKQPKAKVISKIAERALENHPLVKSGVNFSRAELEMRLGKEFTDSLPDSLTTGTDRLDSVGVDVLVDFANINDGINYQDPSNNAENTQRALYDNPEHTKRVEAELKELGNAREAAGGKNTNRKRMSTDLRNFKLSELDPDYFALRARSARLGAEEARAAGNLDLAIELKRVELSNTGLYTAVKRGLAEVESLGKTAIDFDVSALKELTLNQAIKQLRASKHQVANLTSLTASITGDLFWAKGRTDINTQKRSWIDTFTGVEAYNMSPEILVRFLEGTRGYGEGGELSKALFGRAYEAQGRAYDYGTRLQKELAAILNPADAPIWNTAEAYPITAHLAGENVKLNANQQRVADSLGQFLDVNLIEFKGKPGDELMTSVIRSYMSEVRSATHSKLVAEMKFIVNNDDFRKTVIKEAGEERYKALSKWVEDFGGSQQVLDGLDGLLNTMRKNYTRGVLATYNPFSAAKQLTDIFLGGASSVANGQLLAGLPKISQNFVVHGFSIESQKFARGKSKYLEAEFDRFDADLEDAKANLNDDSKKLFDRFTEGGGVFLSLADRSAKTTVWTANYSKALAEGFSEAKAIATADANTRLVFTSASPASRTSGQRSTGAQRLLSVFATPLISALNSNQLALSLGGGKGATAIAQTLVMGTLADAMISIIAGFGPKEGEDPVQWLFTQMWSRQLSVLTGVSVDKPIKALTSGRALDAAALVPVFGPVAKLLATPEDLSDEEFTEKEMINALKAVAGLTGVGAINGAIFADQFGKDRLEGVPLTEIKK
jgi:hypothetical protein